MPFCLHLNMLIFYLFIYLLTYLFSLNSRWFCFPSSACSLFFFFSRISAGNLCLTWLFLSTEASPVVGRAPSHWAELAFGVPFSPQKCFQQGSAVKCRIHTLTEHSERCTQRKFSLDLCQRNGFCFTGFVLFLSGLSTKPRGFKEPKTVLEQLSKTQWFVLLVHFGINKRPNEIKTKKGEKGGD